MQKLADKPPVTPLDDSHPRSIETIQVCPFFIISLHASQDHLIFGEKGGDNYKGKVKAANGGITHKSPIAFILN